MVRLLGKRAPRRDARTFKLERYLPQLPPLLSAVTWADKVSAWQPFLNDQIGDCAIAAPAHMEMLWSAYATAEIAPTDAQVLSAYEAVSGYVPGDPSTDNGCVELDVLRYWKANGIAGHKIDAYMSIEAANIDHLKAAIMLFGGAYIGLALPATAEAQLDANSAWDVVDAALTGDSAPGSWGGHAINLVGYNTLGFVGVTWGALQPMTTRFIQAYMDEAWAVLSPQFFDAKGNAPSGFDVAQLKADLSGL